MKTSVKRRNKKENNLERILKKALIAGALLICFNSCGTSDRLERMKPEISYNHPNSPAQLEKNKKRITFEEALKDNSKRANYIEQLESEIKIPLYVTNLSYLENEEKINNLKNQIHLTRNETYGLTCRKANGTSEISILPPVFNKKTIMNERDLMSLILHEIKHAEQNQNYYRMGSNLTGETICRKYYDEINANSIELENVTGLSKEYVKYIEGCFADMLIDALIRHCQEFSDLEPYREIAQRIGLLNEDGQNIDIGYPLYRRIIWEKDG